MTTSRRAPSGSVVTPAIRLASNGPACPSSLHSTRLAFPVLATAANWLCTAARDGRSTNAVSGLPVAYPGEAPISSPARPLARRTVPSGSSTNNGAGALWKTARSRPRSADESGEASRAFWSGSVALASVSLVSTSAAASSSANAASSSARGSAPGMAAACRRASHRPARSAKSVCEAFGLVSWGMSPDHPLIGWRRPDGRHQYSQHRRERMTVLNRLSPANSTVGPAITGRTQTPSDVWPSPAG